MRIPILLALMLCTSFVCRADDVRTVKELAFQDIFANRVGGARQYFVVGGGWLRTLQMRNLGEFIAKWLENHPTATAKPISHQFWTNIHSKVTNEEVYIWVEDGSDSLNVDLIRAGMYPGGIMADMVDQRNGLDELLNDPTLADVKADVEKERAENPQDRAERLIADDEYKVLMHRIEVAESQARQEKAGIWSDEMKEEREAEEYQ